MLIIFPMNQILLHALCPDDDVTACFLQHTTHEPHAPGQVSIYRPLYWQSRHSDAPIQSIGLFNLLLQWHTAWVCLLKQMHFNVILTYSHRCLRIFFFFLLFAWLWYCVMIPCMLGWNCLHRWKWHLVAPHVPQL